METHMNADAVVIGGGVIGTAIAYYLARKNCDPIRPIIFRLYPQQTYRDFILPRDTKATASVFL
jgi:hypothetical protein